MLRNRGSRIFQELRSIGDLRVSIPQNHLHLQVITTLVSNEASFPSIIVTNAKWSNLLSQKQLATARRKNKTSIDIDSVTFRDIGLSTVIFQSYVDGHAVASLRKRPRESRQEKVERRQMSTKPPGLSD